MAKHRANGEGNIRKRADGRWEARYYDLRELDPKKQRKSIINKSQAVVVRKLKDALSEISGGEKLLVNDNPTVADWLELWMNDYKISEIRDTTYENYEREIENHINPILGNVNVKQLTGAQVQYFFNVMQARKNDGGFGLGSASVIKCKNILSGAMKQAIKNNIVKNNPVEDATAPPTEAPEVRILTKEEQRKFISVLPFFNTGNMFAVALATGMRIGELCALNVGDINRDLKFIDITKSAGRKKDKYTGEVSIKVGPPKTKNSIRKIPLLPSVEIMLDRQAALVSEMRAIAGKDWNENTLVFPTSVGNIRDRSGLRTAMSRITKRAGLPHTTLHSLRHTYATTALNAGVAAQNVAKLLGHRDGSITLRFYAHYINLETMTQLEKLEQQNISHLGITASELERIISDTSEVLKKSSITERIDEAVNRAKNFPPKKSVEMVLSVCEDILCEPANKLSAADKDMFIGVLAQYTIMKRQYAAQERAAQPKAKGKER